MSSATGCLLTIGLGATVAFLGTRYLPVDVTSAVVAVTGAVGTLSTVGLVQVLTRRKDVLSAKPLSDWHQEKMESVLNRRHRRLVGKWIMSFLVALLTAAAGVLLRIPSAKPYEAYLAIGGYFFGVVTVVLVILIALEFYALHMLWEALRREANEHERATSFYQDAKA